jgi:hypothetical protein
MTSKSNIAVAALVVAVIGSASSGATAQVNVVRNVDTIVNNTNANLKNTDRGANGETSIAVNPVNPNEIEISAFNAIWGGSSGIPVGNAVLFHSTNGGQTWTQEFSIPAPPGVPADQVFLCPCDQTFDYGRNNVVFGSILTNRFVSNGMGGFNSADRSNVFSGSTNNPTLAASWAWFIIAGNAQRTNQAAGSVNNADQPWLLRNRGTTNANTDNVFVAYDDFSTNPATMRVAASINNVPPQFPAGSDPVVGTGGVGVNPGQRLATDPRNGFVYSLFQLCTANCTGVPTIQYRLNRSTNQGAPGSWTLNGSATGIVVATANSTQPTPKFGGVNELLGGVDHAAVDPTNGDLYYVYGNRDASGNNRLAIRRVFDNGAGGVNIGAENFVVGGTVQAALPSVAVNNRGTIGVFYYTFNGMVSTTQGAFPQFSTFLATSTNQGATFATQLLKTFLSPVQDTCLTAMPPQPAGCNDRQRVWGDYVQMKSLGDCFYGSFVANRAAYTGPPAPANPDPIFFKACSSNQFGAFNAVLTEYPNVPEFSINSSFTLGSTSTGINPATEPVTLQIGNFTITIPAGSFSVPNPGHFTFVGVINGISLNVVLTQTGVNTFIFGVIARNVNLTTINPAGPVGITLTIGNDSGTTSVTPIINNATP